MIVTKVFAKNDAAFLNLDSEFLEVTVHTPEASYDEEDKRTWFYVESIYAIKGETKIDITWIITNNFPKFELYLLENYDWESND